MARIEFSPASLHKLLAIHDYISNDLASPLAAQNTVNKILIAIERLERYPESGPRLKLLNEQIPVGFNQTRLLVSGKHVAIYDYEENTVRVLQIYHCTEDYIHHLLRSDT